MSSVVLVYRGFNHGLDSRHFALYTDVCSILVDTLLTTVTYCINSTVPGVHLLGCLWVVMAFSV